MKLKKLLKRAVTTADWKSVDETCISLPVMDTASTNEAIKDGLNDKFALFKNTLQNFFPNLGSVTGVAYYQ